MLLYSCRVDGSQAVASISLVMAPVIVRGLSAPTRVRGLRVCAELMP